jgi:hypothetical protein
VKTPEEALDAARARAAQTRPPGGAGPALPVVERDRAAASRRLAKWAIVEPDKAQVYSTRRLGAPITALKRLLIRLLRQYLDQVTAQQSRFNAHAAAYILELESRVSELEAELQRRDAGGGSGSGSGAQAGAQAERR